MNSPSQPLSCFHGKNHKNGNLKLGQTPKRHIERSYATSWQSLGNLAWIVWEICSGQNEFFTITNKVTFPWKPKKWKFESGSNPQKAHLGIICNMLTKFGEPSMDSLGDMLRTKWILHFYSQSHVSMETVKMEIWIWVKPPKGTSRDNM